MRQERWVDKRRVEVTLMSRRKEYKGQVGKRMGSRQPQYSSTPRTQGRSGGDRDSPFQDRKASGTETCKCCILTVFSDDQVRTMDSSLGLR